MILQKTNLLLRESVLSSFRHTFKPREFSFQDELLPKKKRKSRKGSPFLSFLTILEIIQKNMKTFTLNTIFLNNNTSTSHNLPRIAFTVDLAKTSPGS